MQVKKGKLQTKNHAAFKLHYHVVLVTKYRRRVINKKIESELLNVFESVLKKWDCNLDEMGAEADHVHLLIEAHPNLNLSRLISNLKSVSARLLGSKNPEYLARFYWKPYFWSKAFCVLTTGGENLDVVREYVLSQENPTD